MYVLLYPDILFLYLKNRHSLSKNKNLQVLANLIESDSNKLVVCEGYFDMFSDYLDSQGVERDLFDRAFQSFIDDIYNENKIYKVDAVASDLVSYFHSIKSLFKDEEIICVVQSKVKSVTFDEYVVFYNDIKQEPSSYGWLKMNLMSNKDLVFLHIDFSKQEDILDTFNAFYKLLGDTTHKNISILTRDTNLSGIAYFDGLKKSASVKYYTRRFKTSSKKEDSLDSQELNKLLDDIIALWGRNSELWLTQNPNLIHERKVICSPYVLTVDDDFGNLSIKRKTWTLSLFRDKDKCDKYLEKCSAFKRYERKAIHKRK